MNPRHLYALMHPLEKPSDDQTPLRTKTADPYGNLLTAILAVDR